MEVKVTFPNAGTEGNMPKGKRTIRRTVAGSLVGYVGRHMWANFGEAFDPAAEDRANRWRAGLDE